MKILKRLLILLLALMLVSSCACRTGIEEFPNDSSSETSNLSVTTVGSDLETAATGTADLSGEPETTPEPLPETTLPESTTEPETTEAPKTIISLNKKRVMFVGNSFTCWDSCVNSQNSGKSGDNGYFFQVAKSFGDNVLVTNYTFPNYYLSASNDGAYERMLAEHPYYYNNPNNKSMDPFYKQDYVILQQYGSNISSTLTDARKIMALFPPETKFCFYVTTNDVEKNRTSNLGAAKLLRDRYDVIYLPVGHIAYDLWQHTVTIPDTKLQYSRNTFIVARTSSDGFHPNFLTGYITALMIYCAITGNSAVGADWSFVSTSMRDYILDTSNFDKVLASETDMLGIQKLIDEYIAKYNP